LRRAVARGKIGHVVLTAINLNLRGLRLRQVWSGIAGDVDTPLARACADKGDCGAVGEMSEHDAAGDVCARLLLLRGRNGTDHQNHERTKR